MNERCALLEDLLTHGFRRIVIADDATENIIAASELCELLPGINFTFFSSGQQVLEVIKKDRNAIDLIVTDNNMEAANIGIRVMEEAWWKLIPAFIASGGFRHANVDNVILTPFIDQPLVEGVKSDTETWVNILRRIIESIPRNGICGAIARYRTIATEMPPEEWLRKIPRQAAEHAFDHRTHH